jgi:Ser/Thr protein kinase RdoA (MazF antagonist)
VTAKTKFSKTELTEILSDYDLGVYKDSEPLTDGTVQTNYSLKTEKGKAVLVNLT